MMNAFDYNQALSDLEWHIIHGAADVVDDTPSGLIRLRTVPENPKVPAAPQASPPPAPVLPAQSAALSGTGELRQKAAMMAVRAHNLESLRAAIESFDGLAIKQTATQMVFADGNSTAHVMVIGEAPGAEEDRTGKPFVGESGQLLDRIFKCIDLDRTQENPEKSLYITNILNWRPPGNRTPTAAEVQIALPFIERHIALLKPKMIVLCGVVAAQGLLGSTTGISRLRKTVHEYKTLTPELAANTVRIPTIAMYHPAYLLRTPSQKKAVWEDMLMLQSKLE